MGVVDYDVGLLESARVRAEQASVNAGDAAIRAQSAADSCESAAASLRSELLDWVSSVDSQLQRRLMELAQMSEDGVLSVSADSVQLFEDFVRATGWSGSYEDFLHLLGEGGGGDGIVIDKELSLSSGNAVENRAVAHALEGKQDRVAYLTNQELDEMFRMITDV